MRHITFRALLALFITFTSLTACTMEQLPRNMKLTAFDPHKKDFTCVFEATKVPPLDPLAEEWFQEGMALTSDEHEPEDKNFKAAAVLWEKAAARKHWKAMINLASMYATGRGQSESPAYVVDSDTERAVLITEEAMRLGIPAAFDLMGTLHSKGRGVNVSADRAYAFWQLAAEMGSSSAMAFLGKSLRGAYDDPKMGQWGNHKVAIKMLECGMAQGNAKAAFELGVVLDGDAQHFGTDFTPALNALQNALKFGSEEAAGYLASVFDVGDPMAGNARDPSRADRYSTLGRALRLNADLRFPNLDKVLPLPPAQLPKWDGEFDSLVNAAKGVRAEPKPQKLSAHSYPQDHRAHLPSGTELQVPGHLRVPVLPGFTSVLDNYPISTGLARAQVAGYWQARPIPVIANESPYVTNLRRDLVDRLPLRFDENERMQLNVGNTNLPHSDETHYLVEWHFAGRPVPMHQPIDWLVRYGVVRSVASATDIGCPGDQLCIATGIWQPYVLDEDHPLHSLFGGATFTDAWKWQAFVQAGQPMPSLQAIGLPIEDAQVNWRLMQKTDLGFAV